MSPAGAPPSDDPKVVSLSRFRVELSRSLARRGKKLLEAQKLSEEVAELSPLEAYFVVKELGSDTALPILQHFTDEQFQTLIDIDGWHGDAPQFEDIDAWLAVYGSIGAENLAAAFLRLDPELQTLHLRAALTVWDLKLDAIPEPTKKARRKDTPDSFFHIEARDEIDWEVDPFVLVDAIYGQDVGEGTRQMLAARAEQTGTLAEDALRFRDGRLEDWGFPRRDRAMRIFTRPSEDAPPYERSRAIVFSTIPALYAAPLTEGTLFMKALALIDDEGTLRALQEELVFLVNAAVVGFGGSVRDVDHVLDITERVRDTVSLGLALRAGSEDPAAATAVVRCTRLEDLFRTGHFALEEIARAARSLTEDPVVGHWLERSETEADDYTEDRADRAFLRALVAFPATYAGFDRTRPERVRAPATADELRAIRERLDALADRLR